MTQNGLIDRKQADWWSEPRQRGEREVEQESKAGQVGMFESVHAALPDLHEELNRRLTG